MGPFFVMDQGLLRAIKAYFRPLFPQYVLHAPVIVQTNKDLLRPIKAHKACEILWEALNVC